jgi:uncharacterized protein (TIGR02271 family)
MQTSTRTVVGVFDDYDAAQRAVDRMIASAFSRHEIEVNSAEAYADKSKWGKDGTVEGSPRSESSGGGISGFFRWLVGADLDEDERGIYAEAVRRGNVVVTVTADESKQDLAADIMNENGAIDIDRRVTWWKEHGYRDYDSTAAPFTKEETARERESFQNNARSLPVVKEELLVGKRAVQRGGVRVYNRLREEPVEQPVNLREEHVRVERRRADRPATEADIRQDEVIEVAEMAEEPVVEKRARVVEEVVVGKEATERTETIRDTVRRSEVNVEQLAGGAYKSEYDEDFRRHFKGRFGTDRSATFETYAPAYDYGYRMASDQRYRGRNWDDVESRLRTDYERDNPNSAWDRVKGAVQYGWEKVSGRH